MRKIKIVAIGPRARDIKKVEIDGIDITNMLTYLNIEARAGGLIKTTMELLSTVEIDMEYEGEIDFSTLFPSIGEKP